MEGRSLWTKHECLKYKIAWLSKVLTAGSAICAGDTRPPQTPPPQLSEVSVMRLCWVQLQGGTVQ